MGTRRLSAAGLGAGILGASLPAWPAVGAGSSPGIANFMSLDRPWARNSLDFFPPESGLGPVTYDHVHPQFEDATNQEGVIRKVPLHLGDANNPNPKPWVARYIRKANAEVLAGRLRHTSRSNCMPGGVPEFLLFGGPAENEPIYFIQRPKEVLIIEQADTQVRHVYRNVPHSAHPEPSWYGESVGHYEGDTLVVDTIGFNDESQVDDNYAVPHSAQLHVTERTRLIDNGKTLEASFTVEDRAPSTRRGRLANSSTRCISRPCWPKSLAPRTMSATQATRFPFRWLIGRISRRVRPRRLPDFRVGSRPLRAKCRS
jgi:hypothetical protein